MIVHAYVCVCEGVTVRVPVCVRVLALVHDCTCVDLCVCGGGGVTLCVSVCARSCFST